MKGEAKNLAWLNSSGILLEVPFFQRPYVWDRKDWEILFNDIMAAKDGKMPFIGSIILQPADESEEDQHLFLIIDGQQRMLTLSLLVKAYLKRYLEIYPGSQYLNTFIKFKNMVIVNKEVFDLEHDYEETRLRPSNSDKENFDLAMEISGTEEDLQANNSNIVNCYRYFKERIDALSIDEYKKLGKKISTDNSFFIAITLEKWDDEQKVFDSVNSTGKRLTNGDIIKNYLYHYMRKTCYDYANNKALISDIYDKTWDSIFYANNSQDFWYENIVVGRTKTNHLENFLKDFGIVKGIYRSSEFSSLNQLDDAYKKFLCNNSFEELKSFSFELAEYAKCYRSIYEDFKSVKDFKITDRLTITLLILHVLNQSTFNAYILKLCKERPNNFNEQLFALQRFILTRLIYNASNKPYNKLVEYIIDSEDPIDYLDKYNKNTEPKIEFDRFPKLLLNITNNYATLLLSLIEMIRRDKNGINKYTDPFVYNNKSLEHIMPQKWQNHWLDVPCYDFDLNGQFKLISSVDEIIEVRSKRIYSIGNMTLLTSPLNTSVSNECFEKKIIGKGNKNSGIKEYVWSLSVARDIVSIYETKKSFDERDIADREEKLLKELNDYYGFTDEIASNNTPVLNLIKKNEDEIIASANNETFTENHIATTKIGILVREGFTYLFNQNMLDDDEMKNLMDATYSKNTFGVRVPVLADNISKTFDSNHYCRYYRVITFKRNDIVYYLTNEWYEENKERFVKWLLSKLTK